MLVWFVLKVALLDGVVTLGYKFRGIHPCKGWQLPVEPLHGPWCYPERQQVPALYIRALYIQFCGYKGNYFNFNSCYTII